MTEANSNLRLLESRHSVRSFSLEEIPAGIVVKLKAEVSMTNSHEQGMRFQLVVNDSGPFDSFSHSYGLFRNARNYLAAVVDVATPDAYERAGYFGERFAIKAVNLGLGTCFVSGTFDSSKAKVQVRAGEKVVFLIALGIPLHKDRPVANFLARLVHRKEMRLSDFFEPEDEIEKAYEEFPELRDGIKGIACAPSAMNRRPVRVFIDKTDGMNCLCAKVKDGNTAFLIDLGIAKFNFNYATASKCRWGNRSALECGEEE